MSKKEERTVKVKVLRAFQDFEAGQEVELDEHRLKHLEARRMVVALENPKPAANRAVGLEDSDKKVSKRAK